MFSKTEVKKEYCVIHYAHFLTRRIKSLSAKSPLLHQFLIALHSVAFARQASIIGHVSQGHSLLFSGPSTFSSTGASGSLYPLPLYASMSAQITLVIIYPLSCLLISYLSNPT